MAVCLVYCIIISWETIPLTVGSRLTEYNMMDIITDIESVEENQEDDGLQDRGRRPFRERRMSGTSSMLRSNSFRQRRWSRSESRPEKVSDQSELSILCVTNHNTSLGADGED